jgi:hypothetical protein
MGWAFEHDGIDCSYLCDIAVHPRAQGAGLVELMQRG